MAKGDQTVAVEPYTMDCITEISGYEMISKKDVVAQAVKLYYNTWCMGTVEEF